MTRSGGYDLPPEVSRLLDHDWRLLINGTLTTAKDGGSYTRVSHWTEPAIAEVPNAAAADVDLAVSAASRARTLWRDTPPLERSRAVHALATRIAEHSEELARLDTVDTGSPI